MMQILRSIPELSQLPGPLFLAIGVFDGVHLGHQAVVSTSAEHARTVNGTPVVVTFDPHPEKILRPDKAPHLLTATPHKIALIRILGVRHLLITPFDKHFAATEPEEFVEQLVQHSKPLREICVGHEWSFGRNRRGNLELLKKLGAQFDFNVVGIPPVAVSGEIVSSTTIRRAIESGDLKKAATMLGRKYTILGTVVHGDDLGKKIGFLKFTCSISVATFTAKSSSCASSNISGRRRNSRTLMRWFGKSSAMCNRRANWPQCNQVGASKIQPGQIAYFGRLADGENDSKRADYEAATKREH